MSHDQNKELSEEEKIKKSEYVRNGYQEDMS